MKRLIIAFLFLPLFSIAQSNQDLFIKIDVKPIDALKGYTFEIYRNKYEIKIVHRKVERIGKFSFSDEDKKIISRLILKINIDSLTQDSIAYYQNKLDAIKVANTTYKIDSMSIYKTTHKSYFKFLEEMVKIPDSILVEPQMKAEIKENTYCFFTIKEGRAIEKRVFYIECLEPKMFPILSKLVNDSNAIANAHKAVMDKKH